MLVPRVVPEHDLDALRGPTARLQKAGCTKLLAAALTARNDELQECTLAACMHLVAAHPAPAALLADARRSGALGSLGPMIRSSSDVTRTLAIALIKAIELWRGQAEVLPQIDRHDHFYIQVCGRTLALSSYDCCCYYFLIYCHS